MSVKIEPLDGRGGYEQPRITTLDEAAVASAIGPVRLSTAVDYNFESAGSGKRPGNESGPNRR